MQIDETASTVAELNDRMFSDTMRVRPLVRIVLNTFGVNQYRAFGADRVYSETPA